MFIRLISKINNNSKYTRVVEGVKSNQKNPNESKIIKEKDFMATDRKN
ncbi:hypothetical protein K0U27_01290 [archaeon]|nr:hypothetical protein [archaeon]